MKLAILFLAAVAVAAVALFGQQAEQVLMFYDGSSNLEYVCTARSRVSQTAVSVSTISNANPGVATATAHGLTNTAVVRITGATAGWAGINGTWLATVTTVDAFSIPVNTSGFGSFSGQSITVTTVSPRTNFGVWKVLRLFYDGSNNLIRTGWAAEPGGAGSSRLEGGAAEYNKVCADRASYAYQ